ncbi:MULTISPECIES: TrlF family AAA-like ATPase [unclassified Rhizobium]|uniref:TrlF family AAA-like ATPase n=1 Tax=unclassified Rhizobium TaxID=2613769 RepID=UPI001AE739FE|nr:MULTISPECIES: AAA family ATPase [unclassified Rhizobium]MBP2460468.1 putative ATPase [Rhizobium sp. PvP014]MBP2527865.1 putative ATPase [Rhizobium sp. PvP099]
MTEGMQLSSKTEEQRGSIWRKWDLHVHAPGTKLADNYGVRSDELWERYIQTLESSAVQAFGITDYFSFDGYLETIARYRQLVPGGKKLFIPNIEFRLLETVSTDGRNVNSHVLIDPEAATQDALAKFLSDLETHITAGGGRRIRCGELKQAQFAAATVSVRDIEEGLRNCFSPEEYFIVTAAGNDGLRGAAKKSQRSLSISDELDRASAAFFGKAGSSSYFLLDSRYEDGAKSDPKPVFDGSDAHSFADLSRLTGDEPSFQSTWIKANLTFRGLRQTLFEPEHRVFIGDKPPVLTRLEREGTRFIDRLNISPTSTYGGQNGTWFQSVDIPFNPELTAIIGNKGSGKSAIADILALLGDTRQAKYFSFLTDNPSNKKFKRPGYAEHFRAKLTWKSGSATERLLSNDPDKLKPEAVKYLPQNYFESLTNEIEVQELRREIEDVVFSHVDLSDRIDASSFHELEERKTLNSRQEASQLKSRLRELNVRIVELEAQSEPAFRARLVAELDKLKSQVQALEASKPPEEQQPPTESDEQKAANDGIGVQTTILDGLIARGKDASVRLAANKTTFQETQELLEAVTAVKARVDADKISLKERFGSLGFDLDNVITVTTDTDAISARSKELAGAIRELEHDAQLVVSEKTDISKLRSIPDMRAAHQYVSDGIKALRDALSAPQQRYQKYSQAIREIADKIAALTGDWDAPVAGTIADLEMRIARVDKDLAGELDKAYLARHSLCLEIFECKRKIKTFYEELKSKVETRLAAVSTGDFNVSIDASFVLSSNFGTEFFSFLNQAMSGPFRGVEEGANQLRQRLSAVDWNSMQSVLPFVDEVIASMRPTDIKKQVKDVKKLYDFLYSLEYFEARYELRLGGKNLNQLSPGEKGLLLLVFYLHLDMDSTPLIIDQPEDNLDNDSIFAVLARCIREAKKTRQVILVTHNPNLAVGADAEQIVYVRLDKVNGYHFSYESGAIEHPSTNGHIVKILEGSRPAFVQRRLKYQIV